MILIDSDCNDHSTDDVQDWLYYLVKPGDFLYRSNGEQKLENISIRLCSNKKFNFKYNTQSRNVNSSEILSYWYRRGVSFVDNSILSSYSRHNKQAENKGVLNYLIEENKAVFDVINKLKDEITFNIGNFKDNFTNKLVNLINASKCGLLIPDTLISGCKIETLDFINNNKKVIVKNITQAPFIQDQISEALQLSIDFENFILDKNNAKSTLKEEFELSLFQKYIEKKLELRVFFINGFFFTTAIFSQASDKTKVDYRNYDLEKPNRVVPFELPNSIKKQISNFMKLIDMNCGSIDMIYSTNSKFYFLEINPIGQFQANERGCNFNISKLIASFLLKAPCQ